MCPMDVLSGTSIIPFHSTPFYRHIANYGPATDSRVIAN